MRFVTRKVAQVRAATTRTSHSAEHGEAQVITVRVTGYGADAKGGAGTALSLGHRARARPVGLRLRAALMGTASPSEASTTRPIIAIDSERCGC